MKELWTSAQKEGSSKAEVLAVVPPAAAHFALDTLLERPVQAQLVELLLLPHVDRQFTNCVLVHILKQRQWQELKQLKK